MKIVVRGRGSVARGQTAVISDQAASNQLSAISWKGDFIIDN